MNIEIKTLVTFSGPAPELEPLVRGIVNAVIEHGYANQESSEDLVSLVILKNSGRGNFINAEDFVVSVAQDAITVVMPMEVDDEAERERESMGSGNSGGQD